MAKATALSVLVAARKLITPRRAWIKGDFGKDAKGKTLVTPHPDAVRFCSIGAIRQAAGKAELTKIKARETLRGAMNGDILNFNDDPETTHRQVLAAFGRAIKKLRKAA